MIRKAVSTVSLLWLATMFSSGLAFITQIILARQLGVVEFGSFSAALATVNLVAPLAGFGVNGFWLNIFGKEGWAAVRWIKPSLIFSLYSTCAVILLIVFFAALSIIHDEKNSFLLIILSGTVVGQAVIQIVCSWFQLEENYFYFSIWQILQYGLRLAGIGVICIFYPLTAFSVAFVYTTVAVLLVVFSLNFLSRMLKGNIFLKKHGEKSVDQESCEPSMIDIFHQVWSFGLAGFFYFVYFQSDIILLKYLSSDEQVGIYNVAFTVMSAVYLFPAVIYQKYLLPKIQRWANHDMVTLRKVYFNGNRIMFFIGFLTAAAVILLAPFIIPLLFGSTYSLAIDLLFIFAFAIPFRFVATSVGSMLVTCDNMKKKINYMGTVAVFNFSLNLFFIPTYGIFGAAITTLASEIVLLLIYTQGVKKYVFK